MSCSAGSKKSSTYCPISCQATPVCTIADMVELALYIQNNRLYTEQVQDFTPTPMSISTCMYYTGLDPFTMKPVHIAKGPEKEDAAGTHAVP